VDYVHPRGKIRCQALGILIETVAIDSYDELQAFAEAMSQAWLDKEKLHTALRETIMGAKK
jgi:hypothetical protein